MKFNFIVKWYEYNLTKRSSRRFFTALGASIYQWYLWFAHDIHSIIYDL